MDMKRIDIPPEKRKNAIKYFQTVLPYFSAKKLEKLIYDRYFGDDASLWKLFDKINDEQENDPRVRRGIYHAKEGYYRRARQIASNFRNKKNNQLKIDLKEKKIKLEDLLDFKPKDFFPELYFPHIIRRLKAFKLEKEKLLGPEGKDFESSFTCYRCRSKKVTYTQAQTRSADESMTTFFYCMNCGNRWKG